MSVNVNTTTNTIVVQNANQTITVVDNENANIVNVTQPLVNVIEVASPGPQGPVGPTGPQGPSVPFTNIGGDIFTTTSSLQVSGSFLVSGSSTFTNIGPAIFSGSANIVGATTMSSALVSGNVTVLGTASINTLVINQTVLSTGSNQLGDSANDTQTLYGSVIIPTGSLTVSGSVSFGTSSAGFFWDNTNARLGIGTASPATTLQIAGTTTTQNILVETGATYDIGVSATRFRDGWFSRNVQCGSVWTANIAIAATNLTLYNSSVAVLGTLFSTGNLLLSTGTQTDAGFRLDVSGSARITNNLTVTGSTILNNGQTTIKGAGATSATSTFLLQNSTPTNLLSVLDNGQVAFTSPTMSLAASQSAFSISPIISASNIVGGQYYGVSITPTFFQTTGSQTETAFRVAATFTSSNATAATGGNNVIADFGSTSAGSQLTVTDVTSGSIYMVNDVSGIPIIEATSNWDVNIYDFPNKVFEKTGSQVNIYGTIRVSGSFILPLSQSVAPQTGSAYWSGSLLFIYNGTRYMSASFA